ncbi:MAG: YihY/virulence factor BrkB family protein [Putridiphycobacter sp.]|nr:YihY/virulence factor BrkB family protein [Putridiphycobacter sp.]
MQNILQYFIRLYRIIRVVFVRKTIHFSRKIIIPGFEGVSLWEILFFFGWSIKKGLISTRASSLAFHFYLALIPFALVLVVSCAYVPFFNLKQDIIPILSGFIPELLVDKFIEGLDEFENSTVNSIISVGFVLALYFISNGFSVMIKAFNSSKIKFEKRSWISNKLISFALVVGFVVSIIIIFLFMVWQRKLLMIGTSTFSFIENNYDWMNYGFAFLFIGTIIYFGIAVLYYVGPANHSNFKFFSAGATLATILIILIFLLYSYYIQNFANYNALYGSVGTVIIILMWIYLNAYALLIGFELNASIHGAVTKKKLEDFSKLEESVPEVFK